MLVMIYVGLIIMWSSFIIWLCCLILVPCLYNYVLALLCKETGQCGSILSKSEEAPLLLRQNFSSSTLSLSLRILNACFARINNITLSNGIVIMPNLVFFYIITFSYMSISKHRAQNNRMIDNWCIEKSFEGSDCGVIEIFFFWWGGS
jgi:hypothetical protein